MITIRKATVNDAAKLEELYAELEEDAVMYQPQHFVMSGEGARSQFIKDMLKLDNQTMFVAVRDGEVVGFAHAVLIKAKAISCLKPETSLYLQDLVVTNSLRSKGIGSMLMDAVKEYGRNNNADFFRTQVFPQNTDGLRFYKRIGFKETMITIECDL